VSQEPATITEARALFKLITEQAVRGYTDSGSFERGHNYLHNGSIYDAVLRGNRLQARCEGRSAEYYDVSVCLVPKDAPAAEGVLADWDCTCLRCGFCKHIVALARRRGWGWATRRVPGPTIRRGRGRAATSRRSGAIGPRAGAFAVAAADRAALRPPPGVAPR
jgi:hypothetical protein